MKQVSLSEKIAYGGGVFPLNRPDRIGAVAAIHGLILDPVEKCRVLELGCGNGLTLLSIAHSMPQSECIGVDLFAPHIEEATRHSAEIGLKNVSFRELDIMALAPESFGQFDFVIAHGVYSWVPADVREKVLSIYRQCLKPNGVGLISYNTYPGWHIRTLVRDAMLFSAVDSIEPLERVADAVAFVRHLSESVRSDSLYHAILKEEVESAAKKEGSILFHDELAEINEPFYFHTFADRLNDAGLKYIAELDPRTSSTQGIGSEAAAELDGMWNAPVRREQFLDFLRCTRFRVSLVCRAETETSYKPLSDSVTQLFLSTNTAPAHGSVLTDASEVSFSGRRHSTFSTNHSLTKSMLGLASDRRPGRLSFDEITAFLRSEFREMADQDFDVELNQLRHYVIELIHSKVIDASIYQPAVSVSISARPKASAFARWQADSGRGYVTNMYGDSISLDNDLIRALIVCLDGTLELDKLPAALLELVKIVESDRDKLTSKLPDLVELFLENLREGAFLVD